jgi:serine/threonine-protein kinase RsbW
MSERVAGSSTAFPGRFSSLAKIARFVRQAARDAGLNDQATYEVELAVDEACTNIIEHGYGGEGRGRIECTCLTTDAGLCITLKDWGSPFDPIVVPRPKRDVPLAKLRSRGAGLDLIQASMDKVRYDRAPGGGNVLMMVKKRKQRAVVEREGVHRT